MKRHLPYRPVRFQADDLADPAVQEEVKSIFHTLLQRLRESFQSGTASPSDHTPENLTLLHVCQTLSFLKSCAETVAGVCFTGDGYLGLS